MLGLDAKCEELTLLKSHSRIVCEMMLAALLVGCILPLAEAEDLISKSLDELLPAREDIPTEWWTGGSSNKTLTEAGFVEGKSAFYYKDFGEFSAMEVTFFVYRFSNASTAEAYCNKEINKIKSEGGYTEVSIAGVFAVLYDWGTEEDGISWGVISNIVFKVNVYNDYIFEDPTDELIEFTNLEISIIPELPSFLILPLFMMATLLAAIVYKRRKLSIDFSEASNL